MVSPAKEREQSKIGPVILGIIGLFLVFAYALGIIYIIIPAFILIIAAIIWYNAIKPIQIPAEYKEVYTIGFHSAAGQEDAYDYESEDMEFINRLHAALNEAIISQAK